MVYGNLPALVTFFTGCIIAAGIYIIGIRYRRNLDGSEGGIASILIIASGIPAVITIVVITAFVTLRYIADIPEIGIEILKSAYGQVLYVIIGGLVVSIFVKNFLDFYEKNVASHTSSDFDDKLIHFLQSVYTYVIWIAAFFIILSVLKVDITPLLATGGLIGIIVGLAAQDTFGNFFSGAMIAADQPFRTGDRIEIQGVIGDVTSVGPRSTRIKTLDSQLVTIPNRIITENMLTNYGLPEITIKVRINIGVGYDSDVEQVRSALLLVAEEGIEAGLIRSNPAPAAYFLDFGPSALAFQLLIWSDQYEQTFEIRDFLNSRIIRIFKESGIEIPYPQMDLHIKNTPPHI